MTEPEPPCFDHLKAQLEKLEAEIKRVSADLSRSHLLIQAYQLLGRCREAWSEERKERNGARQLAAEYHHKYDVSREEWRLLHNKSLSKREK
jgi:hypothetical protein